MGSPLSLSITALSHQGRVRDKNDDHYLCGPFVEQEALYHLELPLSSRLVRQHGLLCAVADGMGGYAGGALASRTILETLSGYFYAQKRENMGTLEMQAAMEEGFNHARSALNSHLRRDEQLREAGTTLAGLLLLENGVALPFHLGDSRVLRWASGFVRPLTQDHTPLAAEIAAGHLSEQDDKSPVEWGQPLEVAAGDVFLLGTDGWHGLGHGLTSRAIRQILNEWKGNDRTLVRFLVEAAVENDGSDNATLLLVRVVAEEPVGSSHSRELTLEETDSQ
jgi:serine/threonine protein phosphatase PrpC